MPPPPPDRQSPKPRNETLAIVTFTTFSNKLLFPIIFTSTINLQHLNVFVLEQELNESLKLERITINSFQTSSGGNIDCVACFETTNIRRYLPLHNLKYFTLQQRWILQLLQPHFHSVICQQHRLSIQYCPIRRAITLPQK